MLKNPKIECHKCKIYLKLFVKMRLKYLLITTLIMVLSCQNPVSERNPSDFTAASVKINEFMVKQVKTITDPDFGEYSGWIEFKNHEEFTVDLSGWIIAEQVPYQTNFKHLYSIPPNTVIEPGGYFLVWMDGRGCVKKSVHADFSLSTDSAKIGLYGPQWAQMPVIDTLSYIYEDFAEDISLGKILLGDTDKIEILIPMNYPTPERKNRLAKLHQISSFKLDIEEPSGLCPDFSNSFLWVVSDNVGGSIYKITKEGKIVKELCVNGEDMEGICQSSVNKQLYVLKERKREIVIFDTLGNEKGCFKVEVEQKYDNYGLEGIAINSSGKHLFTVNERYPSAFIELEITGENSLQQIQYTPLYFGADKDSRSWGLSGLSYEPDESVLWMISDRTRAVFVIDRTCRVLAVYDVFEEDLEAVAVIKTENKIYFVSDQYHTLYVYEYPQPLLKLAAQKY